MKLIKDLGMKDFSTYRKKVGIYECPICKKHFEVISENVTYKKSTKCRQCSYDTKKSKYSFKNRKLYSVWLNMIYRCTKINHKDFSNYGGRGIEVCSEWLDFDNFAKDMICSFKDGLKIDRIDNDGNYEPSNCRWTTQSVQSRNTRLIHKHNTSGYRGVSFSKANKGFISRIKVDKKQYYIGTYYDQKHAAMAYDTFVIVYGLQHTTNFPKGIFQ